MNPFKVLHYNRLIGWLVFYGLVIGLTIGTVIVASHHVDHNVLPAGKVRLTMSQQRYKMGDSVVFTVSNDFTKTVYVTNNCPTEPLAVYRWDGKTWLRVHDRVPQSECPDQSRQVPIRAESSVSSSYDNWQHLFATPGIYRIAVPVDGYDDYPYQDIEVLSAQQSP